MKYIRRKRESKLELGELFDWMLSGQILTTIWLKAPCQQVESFRKLAVYSSESDDQISSFPARTSAMTHFQQPVSSTSPVFQQLNIFNRLIERQTLSATSFQSHGHTPDKTPVLVNNTKLFSQYHWPNSLVDLRSLQKQVILQVLYKLSLTNKFSMALRTEAFRREESFQGEFYLTKLVGVSTVDYLVDYWVNTIQ